MRFLEFILGWNEWLWSLLPDNCEQPNCCRKGVRGNENIREDGTVQCDYCSCREMFRKDAFEFGIRVGKFLGNDMVMDGLMGDVPEPENYWHHWEKTREMLDHESLEWKENVDDEDQG